MRGRRETQESRAAPFTARLADAAKLVTRLRHSVKATYCGSAWRVNSAAGAGGGIQTHTGLRPTECRSVASASSATPAPCQRQDPDMPEGHNAGRHIHCRTAGAYWRGAQDQA